jgi:hypothetical protein
VTDAQIVKLLAFYKDVLLKQQEIGNRTDLAPDLRWERLLSMLPQMEQFRINGQTAKLMRWLGFMQGAFWVLHVFTIDEMRVHNREEQASE